VTIWQKRGSVLRHFTHPYVERIISVSNAESLYRHFTHLGSSFVTSHTPQPVDNFVRLSSLHTPIFVTSHTSFRHFTHQSLLFRSLLSFIINALKFDQKTVTQTLTILTPPKLPERCHLSSILPKICLSKTSEV
jgi:hypothetical protein